jgi:hypothetical protein
MGDPARILNAAATNGNVEVVKLLLNKGASWLDIAQTMDVQQDLSSRSQDEIVKSDKAIEDPIYLLDNLSRT